MENENSKENTELNENVQNETPREETPDSISLCKEYAKALGRVIIDLSETKIEFEKVADSLGSQSFKTTEEAVKALSSGSKEIEACSEKLNSFVFEEPEFQFAFDGEQVTINGKEAAAPNFPNVTPGDLGNEKACAEPMAEMYRLAQAQTDCLNYLLDSAKEKKAEEIKLTKPVIKNLVDATQKVSIDGFKQHLEDSRAKKNELVASYNEQKKFALEGFYARLKAESDRVVKDGQFKRGMALLDEEKVYEAWVVLSAIENYPVAEEQAQKCAEILEEKYQAGLEQYHNCNFEEAQAIFETISHYSDVEEQLRNCVAAQAQAKAVKEENERREAERIERERMAEEDRQREENDAKAKAEQEAEQKRLEEEAAAKAAEEQAAVEAVLAADRRAAKSKKIRKISGTILITLALLIPMVLVALIGKMFFGKFYQVAVESDAGLWLLGFLGCCIIAFLSLRQLALFFFKEKKHWFMALFFAVIFIAATAFCTVYVKRNTTDLSETFDPGDKISFQATGKTVNTEEEGYRSIVSVTCSNENDYAVKNLTIEVKFYLGEELLHTQNLIFENFKPHQTKKGELEVFEADSESMPFCSSTLQDLKIQATVTSLLPEYQGTIGGFLLSRLFSGEPFIAKSASSTEGLDAAIVASEMQAALPDCTILLPDYYQAIVTTVGNDSVYSTLDQRYHEAYYVLFSISSKETGRFLDAYLEKLTTSGFELKGTKGSRVCVSGNTVILFDSIDRCTIYSPESEKVKIDYYTFEMYIYKQ